MKAIIPVAGVGERLRPFTQTIPKPLLPVASKPILGHIIDELIEVGIDEYVLVVGYLSKQIKKFISERYGDEIKVNYVFQEKMLGLGYAVKLALETFNSEEPALIILGDTIVRTDLQKLISSKTNVLGLKEVDDPRRFGVAEVSNDKIIGIEEKPDKPKTNWAVTGIYFIRELEVLKKHLVSLYDKQEFTKGELQLTDALALMIDEGRDFSWTKITDWFDCGTSKGLLETNRLLLSLADKNFKIKGCRIIHPVSIDPSATVENSIIGPNVSIGAGAMITQCIVSDSIIGRNSSVCYTILKDSVIGNEAVYQGSPSQLILGDWSVVREKSQ